ncbi:YeeE/YedE thiosulfate transporter family protein [Paracoccus onubensis]|uniref:YeeE/YedE family protein n=1 Tax=Paracoccus onubensis TaxID=1675788 RepID=A0A418SR03_9RHOB|nr:YeeE/YedE thiosulfate transporter family protein [Paracoccus onubensis]RJE83393.1 YeeE/YedE family protein [Paracoccus onubensis]
MSDAAAPTREVTAFEGFARRGGLVLALLIAIALVALFAGGRFGMMLAVGLGFGIALEGLRFGFAGPWRAMILRREPAGILAQFLSIGIVSSVAIPLLAAHPGELTGAQAPIGWAMIGGAFVFGAAMQVVLGCGSGTLVNAGSGNPVGLLALPFFAIGSFAGAYHLIWWTDLGSLPIATLSGWQGLLVTWAALLLTAALFLRLGRPDARRIPRRLVIAAILLAALAIANLLIAGQPWGVVYGLGLWAAKGFTALGGDLSGSAFWSAPGTDRILQGSILTDYTSLTNIGLIAGAFVTAAWRNGGLSQKLPSYPIGAWLAVIVAGFLLGYSSRLAFGCNVGAFFSGISTGSLHGWVWFVAAFAGAFLGVRLRPMLGLEARQ